MSSAAFSSDEALAAFELLHVHEYHLAVQGLGLNATYNFVFENILPRLASLEMEMQHMRNQLTARVVQCEKAVKAHTEIKFPTLDFTPRSKPTSPIARRKHKKTPSPLCFSNNTDIYDKLLDPDALPSWPVPEYYHTFSTHQPPPELPHAS